MPAAVSNYATGPVSDIPRYIESFGHSDQLGYRIRPHLAHDATALDFYRDFRGPQFGSDFLVRPARNNQLQDLPLALRESLETRAQCRGIGLRLTCSAIAFERLLNRIEQILIPKGLGEKLHSARLHRAYGHRNVAIPGNENDGDRDVRACQFVLKVEPAQAGQTHIQHQTAGSRWSLLMQEILRRFERFRAQSDRPARCPGSHHAPTRRRR